MSLLSVVIPAYNEELMVSQAAKAVREVLSEAGIRFEIIFVDDGSKDRTWDEIRKVSEKDRAVRGIRFSRNFGKESAIFAGLKASAGDCAAVMDCDLQHPPETLVPMYQFWEQGYEVIEGVKSTRGKEGLLHRLFARRFYHIMTKETHVDMKDASDFKLLDRKAIDSILSMPERNMFFRATSFWVGYRTTSVKYEVQERTAGDSKWSFLSLVRYALTNIAAFSAAPLQIITFLGMCCFLFSIILAVYSLVMYFTGHAVEGYTTLLIVLLFIGSAVMVSLGLIGFYLAKIYDEVKHRPRYIISETTRGKENTGTTANIQTQHAIGLNNSDFSRNM